MTQTQGRYVVVDTTLSITDSTPIPGLNGRQGDSGRIVYFALKDGRLPHNLDGQNVTLEVKDAAGKIKVVNGIYDMISATAGLFSMLIPAEVYQAAGDVEEAYLKVTDNKNLVISSVPITFTVFANGIILSANASQDYIDTVQKVIDEFDKRMTAVATNLDHVQKSYDVLIDELTNYTAEINNNAVALKNKNNEFNGNNVFDKDVTVKGKLNADVNGTAAAALSSNTANLASSVSIENRYQEDVDLNDVSSLTGRTYSSYYFSAPITLKNSPELLTGGIVENYVLTSSSIFQRLIKTNSRDAKIWTRIIRNWRDVANAKYEDWITERDKHEVTISGFGGNMTFTRVGNTVTLGAYISNANFKFNNFSKVYDVGTIPAGYRPLHNFYGTQFDTNTNVSGSDRKSGVIVIHYDGSIYSQEAYVKDSGSTWVSIAGTWVTNDDMPI